MIFYIESDTDDVELPGERLKLAREARGESIENAASRCLLSVTVIRGLESNDYSALSGLSFVRGYLQIYAKKLGLADDEILAVFDAWRGTTPSSERPIHQFSDIDFKESKTRRWVLPALGGLFGMLVLALLVVFITPRVGPWISSFDLALVRGWFQATERADEPGPPAALVIAPPTQPAASSEMPAEVSPAPVKTEPPAPVIEEPSAERIATPTASPSEVTRPVPPAVAVQAPAVAEPTPSTSESRSVVPQPAMPKSLGNGFLQLRFSAQSWVEIRNQRGELIMADLMTPGVDFDLEVTEVVEVLIGAVHATEMRFNGERLDLSGRAYQNVARVTLGEPTP